MTQMISDTSVYWHKRVSDTNGFFLRRTVYCERKWSYIRIL